MVRLKLDDTHTLVSDPECYWIETLVIPENKKPYTRRSSGYRRTFNEAVESYIEKKIRSSEAAKITKLSKEIKELKEYFYENVYVPGSQFEFNQELEKALRLEDFFEIGMLMAYDALNRNESCGGHFRIESQTEEGEAKRDDANYMYVAAWEYKGEGTEPELHKEPLDYQFIEVKTRNYKD
jgi:succinate dehydrogenase/fumarate reductase flavoprotein subunit